MELLGSIASAALSASGGGGGAYVAKAVHFDGNAFLSTSSLTAPDANGFLGMSLWFKASPQKKTLFVVDPAGNYTTNGNFGENLFDIGDSRISIDPYPASGNNGFYIFGSTPCLDGVWHNIIFAIQTDLNVGSKIGKVYLDDVDISDGDNGADIGPFNMVYNSLPFFFGGNSFGDNIIGDVSDVWIGPGIPLLTEGDISVPTRRKFISSDKKPVNPSGFPSGAILFSGDATTFHDNQGTGGPFSLTGSVIDATTSPSD